MKHTIKTASGTISIRPTRWISPARNEKGPVDHALITLERFPFPAIDVKLKFEEVSLLAQAFSLVAAELEANHAHG